MSKERPILFSGSMVRAILDGSKTQTRRIVKPQPSRYAGSPVRMDGQEALFTVPDVRGSVPEFATCRYGKTGDTLWDRETWAPDFEPYEFVYRADDDAAASSKGGRWYPSIHMPRWASRITLEVESVRVERLQDISEADAKAEGLSCEFGIDEVYCTQCSGHERLCLQNRFRTLWESINGAGSWEANPWVWVVTFKRINP